MTERVPPNNGLQATRRKRRAPEAGRSAHGTDDASEML